MAQSEPYPEPYLAVRPSRLWAAWLSNRWLSVRDRWFRLRTLSSYRQAPQR